jgi:hypothetical protein
MVADPENNFQRGVFTLPYIAKILEWKYNQDNNQ